MKKIAIVLALALACVSVFAACGKKEEPAPAPVESKEEVPTPEAGSADIPVGPLVGGWNVDSELTYEISAEAKEVFEKAFEGLVGVGYEPIAFLGTQVVAGTNYLFLARGTTVTAQPITDLYAVKVYKDLEGNCKPSIAKLDVSMLEVYAANETQESGPMAGGWTVNDENDQDVNTKLDDRARAGAMSILEPGPDTTKYYTTALLGSQVVNGTNYVFLQHTIPDGETPGAFAAGYAYVDLAGEAKPGGVVILSLAKLSEACDKEN